MEIENQHYKRYAMVYMIEGGALIVIILVLILIVSRMTGRTVVPFVSQNSKMIPYFVYGLSFLLLGAILFVRMLTRKRVGTMTEKEQKAKLIVGRAIVLNSVSYIPAVIGIVLYLCGLTFSQVRNYFFLTIIISYVSFYRYNRFAELVGIVNMAQALNMKKYK